jgi:hypothetical protein
MTPYELEVAAYSAAHKIYNGLPSPDRACAGGFRSRMIDEIAGAIKEALSIHVLASTEPGAATETRSVRPGVVLEKRDDDKWKQPDWMCFVCRYMNYSVRERCRNCGMKRGMERHAFIGRLNRRCPKCELPEHHRIHNYEDGSIIQRGDTPNPLLVERSDFDVQRASD